MLDSIKKWTGISWVQSLFEESAPEPVVQLRRSFFKLNTVLEPKNKATIPLLKMARAKFMAPKTVDLRDYCPPTENQGNTPMCAAYTASHWASNILWRVTDELPTFDAEQIYNYAKKIDGYEKSDGTTLTAVLQVLRDQMKLFDQSCEIEVFYDNPEEMVKYAIHKFGCCLLGLNITEEWYHCSPSKDTISDTASKFIGGHAVLCCGYNREGVIIQNSWGESFGEYGYVTIKWKAFLQQFQYGAVLSRALNDLKLPNI